MRLHFERWGTTLAAVIAGLAALGIVIACIWLGPLNQDEGWYLYAALERAAGRSPYSDFFFTQGPLLPAVYGWLVPLWGNSGVLGGRVVTALLGVVAALLAALLAGRLAPVPTRYPAAVVGFTLCACAVYHVYFMVIPKTYALTAVVFTGGLLSLSRLKQNSRAVWWQAATGGFLLALAAGVRLSFGAALPVVGLWLLWHWRSYGCAWLYFGVGGVSGLLLVYGPAVIAAPENFVFAQTFHMGRGGGGVLFIAGSMARLLRGYQALAAAAVVAAVWHLALVKCAQEDTPLAVTRKLESGGGVLCLLAVTAVGGVHLLSPFPYDDYQVPLMPALAAVVAAWLVGLGQRMRRPEVARVGLVWGVLLFSGVAALAAPQVQEWFVIRQDRFWPVTKSKSDLKVLREVGDKLRRAGRREEAAPLLTPDIYLAVEAGRRVPHGFEMGPFGYFPGLKTETARRLLVLNYELLTDIFASGVAPDAATSGYAWAIGAPLMDELPVVEQESINKALRYYYTEVERIPDFGQGWTELILWRLNSVEDGDTIDRAREKEAGAGDIARRGTGGDSPPAFQTGGVNSGQSDGTLPLGGGL